MGIRKYVRRQYLTHLNTLLFFSVENLLSQLNQSQREAVTYCGGPQLVIAGAGSGKTRVLTYKIAYLVSNPQLGLYPWNILALTFTNKAAREMKERVAQLVGGQALAGLNMGTFHSVFARILRREAVVIGYKPDFTIYDEADSRSLISAIVKEKKLDTTLYKPASVHSRISMAKNRLLSAAAYAASHELRSQDEAFCVPELHSVFSEYERRCKGANVMDFDDLLCNTYRLFKEHDDVRLRYAQRFGYILVDEYQDTNRVQQSIISLLTADNHRVCVVGDDAQSIYAFRGADIGNILSFTKLYPDTRTFKLERNYRSTQNIVNAANSLIAHNKWQIPKDTYSENSVGDPVRLYPASSDKLEAIHVCDVIRSLCRTDGCGYDAFAVLYRTNAQSRVFEDEMRRRNIPYRIYGGLSFYQRKEIKDVLAYFRVVVNPNDEEALKRIVNYPVRGIGSTTLSKISDCAAGRGCSFWHVVSNPVECGLDVNRGTLGKLGRFVAMMTGFMEAARQRDAADVGKLIISGSGIRDEIFKSKDAEDIVRQENIEELVNELDIYVGERKEEGDGDMGLASFLQDVALLTDKDVADDGESRVTLMTIHAAKGLEFANVFVVGMEENIFPNPRSCDTPRMLEEERRLLYVAITRAEKRCYLSYAKLRFRYGHMDEEMPSRFLDDIDPRYVEMSEEYASGGFSSWRPDKRQYGGARASDAAASPRRKSIDDMRPASESSGGGMRDGWLSPRMCPVERDGAVAKPLAGRSESKEFGIAVGMEIEHQRFGRGRVAAIEGIGENTKATIEFVHVGVKQLLLKYARYKVVKQARLS